MSRRILGGPRLKKAAADSPPTAAGSVAMAAPDDEAPVSTGCCVRVALVELKRDLGFPLGKNRRFHFREIRRCKSGRNKRLCTHRGRHPPRIGSRALRRSRCAAPWCCFHCRVRRRRRRGFGTRWRSRCPGTLPGCFRNSVCGNLNRLCLLTLPLLLSDILAVRLRNGLKSGPFACHSSRDDR